MRLALLPAAIAIALSGGCSLHRASAGASLSCLGLGAQSGILFNEDIVAVAAKLAPPARTI